MKLLIFGPKARYDLYLPEFVQQMPVETIFASAPAPSLQAAADNPDTEVIFADAITPISREMMDLLPNLRMIHSEGPSTPSTSRPLGSGASSCATTRAATPSRWRSMR